MTPACLSPFTLPKPTIGVLGELKDTTDGGDVNEAGASTVKVKSSDVKFDALRVKT